jgi:perosamine synthetase
MSISGSPSARSIHSPLTYKRRYTNVQAAIGLEGLKYLREWTERAQAHAQLMDEYLKGLNSVTVLHVPPERKHVYYQYCAYVSDRDELVLRCIQRGVDIETLHVDVCTRLALFGPNLPAAPAADQAGTAVQIPVYSGLSESEIMRIAAKVRQVLTRQMDRTTMVIERSRH